MIVNLAELTWGKVIQVKKKSRKKHDKHKFVETSRTIRNKLYWYDLTILIC